MTRARHASGNGRGILLRALSAFFFSVMGALLKLATEDGVVAAEMLFYRASFGLPVVFLWVATGPGIGTLRTRRPFLHAGRAALGISAILCTFHALTMLSLADATTIGFTAPVFATILSFFLLKEHVGVHRWSAVVLGFVGVAIVMRPGSSGTGLPLTGLALALIGAFGAASVNIALRQMRTEHVAAIVFWFLSASALTGAVMLPMFGSIHAPFTYVLLAGAGIAGAIAQLLMTASLHHAPVAVIAPFDYLQMVGAIAFGYLLMDDLPTLYTIIGGLLIAGSGLYTVWREHRLRRSREARSKAEQ